MIHPSFIYCGCTPGHLPSQSLIKRANVQKNRAKSNLFGKATKVNFTRFLASSKYPNRLCLFFLEVVLFFREKPHFQFNLQTLFYYSESQPTWPKIDHFHSIRMSNLLSAEKLSYNQLVATLFRVQQSNIKNIRLMKLSGGKQSVLQR